jgi:aspartyl/asparaginyl beta-hydroxylase (cupin superfamily)
MKLKAGGHVGAHRDVKLEVANFAFGQVRLHIPISTNDQVFFHIGKEKIHMKAGRLYYANFSKLHSVVNGGATTRIHLMLDLLVNDWLAQFFPALTVMEKMHCALQRHTLPLFWALRDARIHSTKAFWKAYNGSKLQKLRHRLRRRETVEA